ncbi:MAG: S-layer homology domain-containing protein, partial [Clostridiales bacterium]|nr:S-layer homology domain-containing protein [Clostridiales bacterium]
MWRKCMTAVIAAAVSLTVGFTAGVYALGGIDTHWAGKYAAALNQMGIFHGDDYGDARLADPIKRSEFLALLVRAVYSEEELSAGTVEFSDVPRGAWYRDVAGFAHQKGIVKGDGAGRFLPDANVKREEIVLMLVRALELSGTVAGFTDIDEDYAYYSEVCAAVASGIVNGYADGSFAPKNNATRGEAAAMIARMLGAADGGGETPPEPMADRSGASEKINLTWHHLYSADVADSGAVMPGVNVVSPTWFRIRSFADETPASYEYKLAGDNIYYLQDLGNPKYIDDARAKGYQVWALFKSNDFSARNNSGFLNDTDARSSAVNLMRQMILKYDLDGINMDFENMLVSDKDIYTAFVKEMSDMTRDLGVTLSVDVTK